METLCQPKTLMEAIRRKRAVNGIYASVDPHHPEGGPKGEIKSETPEDRITRGNFEALRLFHFTPERLAAEEVRQNPVKKAGS